MTFIRFLPQSFHSWSFLVSFRYFFKKFLSVCLMVSDYSISKYLQFSFSPCVSYAFLILLFDSFRCFPFFSFPLFIINPSHFSMSNSIPISWLYISILYQSPVLFFCKYIYIFYVLKEIKLLLWFCKFVASCTILQ